MTRESSRDWAGVAGLSSNASSGRWRLRLRFLGPGYRSAGVTSERRDILVCDGSWSRNWAGDRLRLDVEGGLEKTGVSLPEFGSSGLVRALVRADFRPAALPRMTITGSMNDQADRQPGLSEVTRRSDHLTLALRHVMAAGSMSLFSFLAFDAIEGRSSDSTAAHHSRSVQLAETMTVPSLGAFGLRAGWTETQTAVPGDLDAGIWNFEGTATRGALPGLESVAGSSLTGGGGTTIFSGFLGLGLEVLRSASLRVRWEYRDVEDSLRPERSRIERIGRLVVETRR
jgi:hypothetical protein